MEKKSFVILTEMAKNSRQHFTTLAKTPYLTKDNISYHLKQFEKQGIIKQYTTKIQQHFFYQGAVYCQFYTSNKDNLIAEKRIHWAATTYGEYNVICSFFFKSIADLYTYLEYLKQKYSISTHSILLYTKEIKFDKIQVLTKAQSEMKKKLEFKNQQVNLDETDIYILSQLATNARIKNTILAKKLNLSLDTIRNRIRALEKKEIIKGYTTSIDFKKLGYTIHILYAQIEGQNIESYIQTIPSIGYATKCIGEYNHIINIYTKSEEELSQTLSALKKRFTIRKERIEIVLEEKKEVYIPQSFAEDINKN